MLNSITCGSTDANRALVAVGLRLLSGRDTRGAGRNAQGALALPDLDSEELYVVRPGLAPGSVNM